MKTGALIVAGALVFVLVTFGAIELVQRTRYRAVQEELSAAVTEIQKVRLLRTDRMMLRPATAEEAATGHLVLHRMETSDAEDRYTLVDSDGPANPPSKVGKKPIVILWLRQRRSMLFLRYEVTIAWPGPATRELEAEVQRRLDAHGIRPVPLELPSF